jgi:hypothetical protein
MERGNFDGRDQLREQEHARENLDAARRRMEQLSVERKEATVEAREQPSVAQSDQRALAAAQEGIDEHRDHYIKAQGRAVERVAMYKLRDDGAITDLNKQVGENFPIYDVASDKHIASVKCKGLDDGAVLSDATKNAYIRDFEEAVGQGTNPEKFANAAKYLNQAAQKSGVELSPEIATSEDSAKAYLRENATLMMPDDHAIAVKNELRGRLFSNDPIERQVAAERMGLDVNARDYDAQALNMLNRIQGAGVYSFEIKQMMD